MQHQYPENSSSLRSHSLQASGKLEEEALLPQLQWLCPHTAFKASMRTEGEAHVKCQVGGSHTEDWGSQGLGARGCCAS